jgi:hypothetical protein
LNHFGSRVVSAQIALPAHLETVRFLKVTFGHYDFLKPILATLPEENSLKKIEITTQGLIFELVAAALDDLLSEHRFRNIVCVQVGLADLAHGMSEVYYAQFMPLAVERGVLQITTVKSSYRPGGGDDDDDDV